MPQNLSKVHLVRQGQGTSEQRLLLPLQCRVYTYSELNLSPSEEFRIWTFSLKVLEKLCKLRIATESSVLVSSHCRNLQTFCLVFINQVLFKKFWQSSAAFWCLFFCITLTLSEKSPTLVNEEKQGIQWNRYNPRGLVWSRLVSFTLKSSNRVTRSPWTCLIFAWPRASFKV